MFFFIFKKPIIISCLCFLYVSITLLQANDAIGSVLGDVTHNSAKMWVYAKGDAEITVQLKPETKISLSVEKSQFSSSSNFIFIEGLEANTSYEYQVLINGKTNSLSNGHFTTAPLPGNASKFSITVISCLKKTNVDWDILANEKSHYLFMLGDGGFNLLMQQSAVMRVELV